MPAEAVCIVLNEREPSKERLAEALTKNLSSKGIQAKRLSADPKLDKILNQRSPKVVILDYIIGDYTTGLDLQQAINEWAEPAKIIFLTDEPSVQVAVEAIKGGALDYILVDNPEAISLVAKYTQDCVVSPQLPPKRHSEIRPLSLKTLTTNSPAIQKCLERARAYLGSDIPLLIIEGDAGTGRSTWLDAIMLEHRHAGPVTSVDWDTFPGRADELLGLKLSPDNPNRLGNLKSFFIDNVERDSGHLFKSVESFKKTKSDWNSNSRLAIGTSDSRTAELWSSMMPSIRIKLPNLTQRGEDISELSGLFLKEATSLLNIKQDNFSGESISFIQSQSWSQNLSQLKRVIFEGALLSRTIPQLEALEAAYQNDCLAKADTTQKITPLSAQIALDKFCGDFRLTAMYLGTSIPELFATLNGAES